MLDRLFRTVRWQICRFRELWLRDLSYNRDEAGTFAIRCKLYERVPLEDLNFQADDLGDWDRDYRVELLLHLHMLPTQFLTPVRLALLTILHDVYGVLSSRATAYTSSTQYKNYVIGLVRTKDDEVAAALCDVLSLGWERWNQVADSRERSRIDKELILELEFWRASAYHNLFVKQKSDQNAKQRATEAIARFFHLAQGPEARLFRENIKALRRLVQEEY
jgi:hypothetical protein